MKESRHLKRIRELTKELTPDNSDIARAVAELLADGIVIINDDSEIVYVSELAAGMFGYSAGELIGQQLSVLIPEDLREKHEALHRQFLIQGKQRRMNEGKILDGLTKTGRLVAVQIGLSPITWNGGKGAVAVLQIPK